MKFSIRPIASLVAVCLMAWLLAAGCGLEAAEPLQTENVLLVTLDGFRWQELFGGCDESLLNKEAGGVRDIPALKAKYWRETPESRRETLMPFFWKTVARQGQVFGDATRGSAARVTNGKNFSYPGYSEILCGFSDPRIDSNDKVNNSNVTMLEWLHRKPAFMRKVAAFTSWDVFPWIINTERSGIPVNAGWQPVDAARGGVLAEVTRDLPRLWDGVRYDVLTYLATLDYLKDHRPRVLYVSLGETDDFAHEGRYDQYLESAFRNDQLIERLWNHLQSLPEYKGKTSLVLTTDHGRGDDRVSWKSHGKDLAMSQFLWIALLGPDTPPLGIREGIETTQSQVAATVAGLLGEDYRAEVSQAGAILPGAIRSQASEPMAHWIWSGTPADGDQTVVLRKTFALEGKLRAARVVTTCDNEFVLSIDGQRALRGNDFTTPLAKDVGDLFDPKADRHVLAVVAKNSGGPAGLLLKLTLEFENGTRQVIVSDESWKVIEGTVGGATSAAFDDSTWTAARSQGAIGAGAWPKITPEVLSAARVVREPAATPVSELKVAKGIQVELLYSVPKEAQGSWVNLCVDPRGRLIVSDQYGGLYRITVPPIGGPAAETRVEPVAVEIGEAQGLLWAFDSLYVVVNQGEKYESGLYRVRDTNNDDQLDQVELLRRIPGGAEHGPHAVVLSPDGQSLYIVCGNGTKFMDVNASRVPQIWGEDHLLPRLPDGNGFMVDVMAPGGCIYRVTPDGQNWELISSGYRNPYDAAFHRSGELFTYDADMEWDVNTPWYRPTRVCLATSGSEFGWRNGAGKWPAYYPDSLPAVCDIGPGSPTGVTFGYRSRFPTRYQEALFVCDWSYGKLYAVHLTPAGSGFTGEVEEFLSGAPLPLTDVVIHPVDGAMYFTIGGRRTKSGLYRVTYLGTEPVNSGPVDGRNADLRTARRRLELLHGKDASQGIAAAWPYLGHADRYLRFAARVALEHQPVQRWQERAFTETNPAAALTALLAVARAGDTAAATRLFEALGRIDWKGLSESQQVDLLRVYGVAMVRLGRPQGAVREAIVSRFDALFPASNRILNVELSQLLVALGVPSATPRIMALMRQSPTQEEQLDYARAIRVQTSGWTPELRREYFTWYSETAPGFRGGASLGGFLRKMKADAIDTLDETEKVALREVIEAQPVQKSPLAAIQARPLVRQWKVEDLADAVSQPLSARNFDRGSKLFGEVGCYVCHRFQTEGGAVGPDLTGAGARFSPRDLLESILEPNKVISDQYAAVIIETAGGKTSTGRIVNLVGDSLLLNTDMTDPNALETIDRTQIESVRNSDVSMMPAGLVNSLQQDEILDLVAYLISRGDRQHKVFASP